MSTTVHFIDQSTPGESGGITDWLWDFGDGSDTSTDESPSHDYADPGSYNVQLDVTSPDGTVSVTRTIVIPEVVDPPPPPPPPVGGKILFDGRATRLSELVSHEVTPPAPYTNGPIVWPDNSRHYFYTHQTPVIWDGLTFIKDDISLFADDRYGKVYKTVCRIGDTNQWHGSQGGVINGAAEVSHRRPTKLGGVTCFAFAVKIDAWNGDPDDLRFCELYSLGYQTSSNSQVAFEVGGKSGALWFKMNANAGSASGIQGQAAGTTHFMDDVIPVVFGQWQEFVLEYKQATDGTGYLKLHHRIPGGTWTQVYSKPGIDTELYGPITDGHGTLIENFAKDASNWSTTLDKMGLYFGLSSQSVVTETVYNTGPVECTDVDTAKATFPA